MGLRAISTILGESRAGRAIERGKRLVELYHPATDRGTFLQQRHVHAAFGKFQRRRDARDAPADDKHALALLHGSIQDHHSRSSLCLRVRSKRSATYRAVAPPSTAKAWPVMKDAASEHNHNTVAATSSAVPSRAIGEFAMMICSRSGRVDRLRSVSGVLIVAGHTALTRILGSRTQARPSS